MPFTWQQILCQKLCAIYKASGGDCADLDCDTGEGTNDAAYTVVSKYEEDGLPPGMSNTAKCDLLGDLNALETHLALPENSLSVSANAGLEGMIAGMRLDIGIVAGCNN